MERIRIRSILNYLKKTQTIDADLKLSEIEPKSSTEDSTSQIISHSSRDNEAENSLFHKYNSFTLDLNQLDLIASVPVADISSSEELSTSILVPEIKKKKPPTKCLISGLCKKKRSYSQNLEELGIAKKELSSRKSCNKYVLNSNSGSEKSGRNQIAIENLNQCENFRRSGNQQARNFSGHPSKQKIITFKHKQNDMRDTKKGMFEGQVRIRNIKYKEKVEKFTGNPEQGISPWATQQQSTNLYYTLQ